MRPLAGVTVLDFSTLLPGPMATLLLAEAGAEVIKIERPGSGEDMRHYAPAWGRDGVNFAMLNRGKKSLALDLKSTADLAKLRPLIETSDIIVEQFRPGVMERLGLGYANVAKTNPRVIYCSITGYGQNGPKRDVAGHDLNYIGDAGLLALSMGTPEFPVVPPALIADIAGGAYPAVMNILLALRERDQTGRGRQLDIAMAEGVLPFTYWAIGSGLVADQWPVNGGELVTGGTPRYQLYPAADGAMVAAAPLEQKFWETFCDIIDLPAEFRDDAKDPKATLRAVAARIRTKPSPAWAAAFAGKDCCCSVVRTIRDALNDDHFKSRGIFGHVLANADGATTVALPVPVDPAFRAPPGMPLAAPMLGADNEDLLG